MRSLQMKACLAALTLAVGAVLSACGPGEHTGEGGGGPGPAPGASLSLLAGSFQRAGGLDGQGLAAQFNQPEAVAQDAAGNLYVADAGNNTIRKIAPGGAVTTLAGTAGQAGSADGTGAAARFSFPRGIAVDGAGTIYVADTGNHTIRRITPAGVVSTLAGAAGQAGADNGPAASARFRTPTDLAIDSAGNLYVAADSAVRRIASDGTVSTFAGAPGQAAHTGGDGAQARFNVIAGVAVGGSDVVYVAEGEAFSTQSLRRFDASARSIPLGTATDGILSIPFAHGIAADAAGNVYIAAGGSIPFAASFVARFNTILKVTPQGAVSVLAGDDQQPGAADGPGLAARFDEPRGIAAGTGGRLFVADTGNHAIRQIDALNSVSTLAGGAGVGRADGAAAQARFHAPTDLAAAADGSLYVADSLNGSVRRIAPGGTVSTLAFTNETGSQVRVFRAVVDVAINPQGGLYVLEQSGNNLLLWSCNAASRCRALDTGGRQVWAITTDRTGTLYLAESDQASAIAPDGTRRVLATGLVFATEIAVGETGKVYVADYGAHTVRILDATGRLLQTLGTANSPGYRDGAAAQALLNGPAALALDSAGSLYIGDSSNTIRKLSADGGTVSTIAGVAGQAGAQPGAALAPLGRVNGLAWMAASLYATVDNAVVKISPVN